MYVLGAEIISLQKKLLACQFFEIGELTCQQYWKAMKLKIWKWYAFFFTFIKGFFLVVSCVIFPLGWDNVEVHQACGENANNYRLGDCTLGCAAFLTFGGILGTLLCAILSIKAGKSDRMKASSYEARYDTLQLWSKKRLTVQVSIQAFELIYFWLYKQQSSQNFED